MTERNDRGLDKAVERRQARRNQWRREGERPLAHNLAMIGSIGWLIVVPMLAGILIGRWLDDIADSGITFTAALLLLGLVAGCALAWRRMHAP